MRGALIRSAPGPRDLPPARRTRGRAADLRGADARPVAHGDLLDPEAPLDGLELHLDVHPQVGSVMSRANSDEKRTARKAPCRRSGARTSAMSRVAAAAPDLLRRQGPAPRGACGPRAGPRRLRGPVHEQRQLGGVVGVVPIEDDEDLGACAGGGDPREAGGAVAAPGGRRPGRRRPAPPPPSGRCCRCRRRHRAHGRKLRETSGRERSRWGRG